MRILKFLFLSLFFLAVVGGGGFLVIREVLLSLGVAQVRAALSQMRSISANSATYIQECQKKGIIVDGQPAIQTIQLRFTSPTEYVVEVVCTQFQLSPVVVQGDTLPTFVTKAPGSSGIIWGAIRSGIKLEVWGRSRAVIADNLDIEYTSSTQADLGQGPVTSCSGYGFTCCAADTSMGQGEQVVGALDCPRTCYSQCVSRPVVLSLVTQPFYDPATRTVNVTAGEQVEFNYVVDFGPTKQGEVTMDFGDGQQQDMGSVAVTSGSVSHAYSCLAGTCRYPAKLIVTDQLGTPAAETLVSSVTVVVGGQ